MTRPPRHPGRPRRDRHGRGLRGRLVPAEVPLARSRAEQFDDLVLDAVEDLERRWERELAGVEFAVEDVPWVEHTRPEDRKSTRLNSSHANISYAVFCLKK